MVLSILILLVGFAILIKGADFLVDGASSLAKRMNVSNLAIGLTVVAFGTSMPELVVSVISTIDGKNDAAFGNVIGSNNFNLLLILGVSGIISPLIVQRNTVKFEIPISLFAIVVLFLLVNDQLLHTGTFDILSRIDAIILLALFAFFLFYIYRNMTRNDDVESNGDIKIYSKGVSVAYLLLGLVMLIAGGKWVVDSAVTIALEFGLSEKLIGLTILAAGTSLPELATSAMAAYKKNTDIAIGNVIGSNIFNILFILGVTGALSPLRYNLTLNFDLIISAIVTIVLIIFMFTLNKHKLDRLEAALMLLGYLGYTIYLVMAD